MQHMTNGDTDIGITLLVLNRQRMQQMAFTNPLYQVDFVIAKKIKPFASMTDFDALRAGWQTSAMLAVLGALLCVKEARVLAKFIAVVNHIRDTFL